MSTEITISSPFSKTIQHDHKYKTILSAASDLFNIYGTRGTTLVQVAKKLNLTKTSLYYYVKNKEDLVYQCYRNTCAEMQAMLDQALAIKGNSATKLEHLLELNFNCWTDIIDGKRGHLAGLTEIASLSTKHQQEISEYYRHFVISLIKLLEEGKADGSFKSFASRETSHAIWGAIFWLPVWLHQIKPEQRVMAFTQWSDTIKYGLKNTDSSFLFPELMLKTETKAPTGFDRDEINRQKQEAFFKAGTRFFNQKGFKGTSLDELASSLGVTKGAFYYHIKNKDDLLIKCFNRTVRIEQEILETTAQLSGTAIDKLAIAAQRLFAVQVGNEGPLIRYANMWSLALDTRQKVEQELKSVQTLMAGLIQAGFEDGSLTPKLSLVAEHIMLGAIESIPELAPTSQVELISPEVAPSYFEVFFSGICV